MEQAASDAYVATLAAAVVNFVSVGGNNSQPAQLTLSASMTGAVIYYTLDGSIPTTSSAVYTAPLTLAPGTTVNAIAVTNGISSGFFTQTYGGVAQLLGSDVGSVSKAGSSSYNFATGVYTVSGSGADIWGTADAYHYVYQTISGDGELVARVASIQNTNTWAKAGVMIRQSSMAGAIEALVAETPGNGVTFQYRSATGSSSVNSATPNSGAPWWVKIVKDGSIITAYDSPDGTTWTYLGITELTALTSPVEIGLAVCSHTNSALCTATFDNITLTTAASFAPPSPWIQQDIGATNLAGGVHDEQDQWAMYASGSDIWGMADAFHYAYQPLSGDGSIQMQVSAMTSTNGWSKSGVMIRSDLTPGAANAYIAVTPGNGVTTQWRSTAGGNSSDLLGAKVTAPYWVKLVRSGNQFYFYQSADGNSWQEVTLQTIVMPQNVYIGVAQTSHSSNALSVSYFDTPQISSTVIQLNSITDTSAGLLWPSLVDPTTVAQYAIYENGVEVGTSTETNFEAIQLKPSTTYAFQVKALDFGGDVLASSSVLNVTTAAAYLPSPWTHLDIGPVQLGGSTLLDSSTGTFSLSASGTDIWGAADQFQFAEQPLTGDGEIIARVKAVSPTNSWTKAGIMLRETNDPGSKHVSLFLTPGNGVAFQYRDSTGGGSTNANYTATGPFWLKLIRQGNQITAFRSNDGIGWTEVGTDMVTMNTAIQVGLALTSHNTDVLAGATIDNVSIQAGLPTTTTPPSVPTGLTATTVGDSSVTIQWAAAIGSIGVTGYNIYRNGQLINTTPLTQFVDTGLSARQTYAYTIQSIDFSGLTSSQSTALNVTTAASGVSPPWIHQEIGAIAAVGMATQSANSFTISASGNDIWNTMDAFGFVEQAMSTNGQITAEVNSVTNTNAWSKAGVMFRNSLDPGSPFVDLVVTPGNGVAFQYRTAQNGNCTYVAGPATTAPYWVRLVRQGNVIQGLASPDGVTWTQVGQVTTTFGPTIYAGLAATSHKNGTLTTANFSQVALIGPPVAPSMVLSTSTTPTSISLNWTNNSSSASSYLVQEQNTDGSWSIVATLGAGATSYTVTGLTAGQSYTFRVVAANIFGSNVSSTTTYTAGNVPQSGLALWLRADAGVTTDSNGNVQSWTDQAGNNVLTQATAATRPTYVPSSGSAKPTVQFKGSQWLGTSNSLGAGLNADMTIITVDSTAAPSTIQYALWLGNSTATGSGRSYGYTNGLQTFDTYATAAYSGAAPPANTQVCDIASINASLSSVTFYRNGTQTGTSAISGVTNLTSGLTIGSVGPVKEFEWNGTISEVLIYNHQLSATELQQVSVYLADKYGLYNPNATWPLAYSAAVQAEITKHQWNKNQADNYVALQANNPTMLTNGLSLWLKADAGVTSTSGSVSAWSDQTGNYTVAQGTVANQPTYVASDTNGKPALRFNGSQWLTTPSGLGVGLNADMTIITVGSTATYGQQEYALWLGNSTATGSDRSYGYAGSKQIFDSYTAYASGASEPAANTMVCEVASIKSLPLQRDLLSQWHPDGE